MKQDIQLSDGSENAQWEEFMKLPSTLPEDLVTTLTNFADEADAHKTADVIRGYLSVFRRLMNRNSLAKVFISSDCEGTHRVCDGHNIFSIENRRALHGRDYTSPLGSNRLSLLVDEVKRQIEGRPVQYFADQNLLFLRKRTSTHS
jgi:hypothetical protein